MNYKEKAKELVEKFLDVFDKTEEPSVSYVMVKMAKENALISTKNEYNALRELLFNLRSCRIIENEKVYLHRLDELIKEEKEVKQEINKL